MNRVFTETGDIKMIYQADELGELLEPPQLCVMCNQIAFFIAKETKEPLCESCHQNNLEARRAKST
jgi:hypothetical protein